MYTGKSRPVVEILSAQLLNKDGTCTRTITIQCWTEWNAHGKRHLYACGTLHVNRGVPKEMKEKIKYLKKWESKYCCKGQILVHVWQYERDVKLISSLNITKIVETEKKNWKGETMRKLEIIEDSDKFVWDVGKADQILNCYRWYRKTMKWNKKFMFFLLYITILNIFIFKNMSQIKMAYAIYLTLFRKWQRQKREKMRKMAQTNH